MPSLTDIFEDTQQRLWDDHRLRQLTYEAVNTTRVFPENFEITRVAGMTPTRISVTGETTLQAAKRVLSQTGRSLPSGFTGRITRHVAILNFANGVNPGGGVVYGANAQEESICRSSNLYPCLTKPECYDDFYRYNDSRGFLYSDRIIYSENVCIFKDEAGRLLDESEWMFVDVITCPAPNLNGVGQMDDRKLSGLYNERIRNILSVAEVHGVHTLILGAFGCGAFLNPPELMAEAFSYQLLSGDFRNTFKEVVFAIKATDPRSYYNYQVFTDYFSPFGMSQPISGRARPSAREKKASSGSGFNAVILLLTVLCLVLGVGLLILFGVGMYLSWFDGASAVVIGILPGIFIGLTVLLAWQYIQLSRS
ncbi:MAG: TIGR02452 family protein [Firmicutes bacterium]|nr:TIGR02452 family protein [Bacillota bacterium]